MTPPMTPREKVAREIATMRMKVDQKNAEVTGHDICLVIDPYLEEAKKDIDAMLTALASGSGDHSGGVTDMVDHAELARLADDPAMDFGGFGRSRVSALLAENAALRAACAKSNDEICQTLGKALGYPWFKDDQVNFPGADDENGVCVGDHVAESLADEAARRITDAERKLADERLNYEGALSDIESLLTVLIRRINGEKDLASAAEWVRLNYPLAAEKIISKEAERG